MAGESRGEGFSFKRQASSLPRDFKVFKVFKDPNDFKDFKDFKFYYLYDCVV